MSHSEACLSSPVGRHCGATHWAQIQACRYLVRGLFGPSVGRHCLVTPAWVSGVGFRVWGLCLGFRATPKHKGCMGLVRSFRRESHAGPSISRKKGTLAPAFPAKKARWPQHFPRKRHAGPSISREKGTLAPAFPAPLCCGLQLLGRPRDGAPAPALAWRVAT